MGKRNDVEINIKATGAEESSAQIDKVNNSVKKLDNQAVKTTNTTSKLSNSLKKINSNLTLPNLRVMLDGLKSMINGIAKVSQYSVDYIENLNLLDSAFGKDNIMARQFANTLAEIYGQDESELVDQIGTFRQFGSALGYTSETANKLAKNLTLMTGDISSLYNISTAQASEKLTSALTGQTKAIRSLGADITQASLQQQLYNMGIDESISNMNRAEKTILIYLSLEKQLINAQGDLAKTIESPSNQIRVMQQQIQRLARAIGNALLPVLKAVLPLINGVLMALVELFNFIAGLLGYDASEWEFGGALSNASGDASELGNIFDETTDSIGGTNDALDETKKKLTGLRGFDKLNVISTPTDNGGSSGGSAGGGVAGGGIDSRLLEALGAYDAHLEGVKMKATQIRDRLLEWLGFSKDINGEWKFTEITFGTILTSIGLLLASLRLMLPIIRFIVGKDGIKLISSLVGKISGALAGKGILGSLALIGKAFGIVAIVAIGLIRTVQGINDLLNKNKPIIDGILKIIQGIALVVAGVAIALGGWVVALVAGIVALVAVITQLVIDNWTVIKEFFINMWNTIKTFFVDIYNSFMEKIINPIKEKILEIVNFIYTKAIKPIIDFFKPILQAFLEVFLEMKKKITEIVTGVINAIGSILSKIKEIFLKIVEILVALGKAFYEYVLTPIIDWLKKAGQWIYDNVILKIYDKLKSIASWIYQNVILKIYDKLKSVASWFYENVILKIWNKFTWLKDKAVKLFKDIGKTVVNFMGNSVKSVINAILSAIEWSINSFIRMLNGAIKLINKIPNVNISTVSLLDIPRLAEGGFVNDGQLFVAREAGPEMVGSINGKTAVANNDQIVQAVSIGVAKAIQGSNMGNTKVVIDATGDSSGLMNFITFKQRQESRQYGL